MHIVYTFTCNVHKCKVHTLEIHVCVCVSMLAKKRKKSNRMHAHILSLKLRLYTCPGSVDTPLVWYVGNILNIKTHILKETQN